MEEDWDLAEITERFKLICRNCGSEDVVMSKESGIDYGGMTGFSPGTFTIGCNGCGANDYVGYWVA